MSNLQFETLARRRSASRMHTAVLTACLDSLHLLARARPEHTKMEKKKISFFSFLFARSQKMRTCCGVIISTLAGICADLALLGAPRGVPREPGKYEFLPWPGPQAGRGWLAGWLSGIGVGIASGSSPAQVLLPAQTKERPCLVFSRRARGCLLADDAVHALS